MATRMIVKNGDPQLRKHCHEVKDFNPRLHMLLDDMRQTLAESNGVGLAAPQVGILKRAVVIDCGDGLVELVNPEILETSGEQGGYEGCLSFPGESGYVVRPNHVRVRAMNRFGEECEYEGEGLFARAILHETDHLNGLVYKRLVTEAPEGYDENEEDE